jgi:hypothetical protein
VVVSRDETTTKVVVQAHADSPLPGIFPALRLKAQAIAATEPQPNDTAFPTGSGPPPAPTGAEEKGDETTR